jgi:hypothetical protein
VQNQNRFRHEHCSGPDVLESRSGSGKSFPNPTVPLPRAQQPWSNDASRRKNAVFPLFPGSQRFKHFKSAAEMVMFVCVGAVFPTEGHRRAP